MIPFYFQYVNTSPSEFTFKPESLNGVSRFQRLWHTWKQGERIPIIKTDRFVAIPFELGQRLKELAEKKRAGKLDAKEEKEFTSLAQLIKIITAEEVVTSYEVASVRESLTVEEIIFEESQGEIDSDAINGFLTQMPVVVEFTKSNDRELRVESLLNQAKEMAESMADTSYKVEALVSIASVLVQSGNTTEAKSLFNQARAIAEIITQKNIKERAFVYIAIALAQAGDITQAKAIAEIITDEFDKTTALVSIARALIYSGRIEEARRVMGAIQDQNSQQFYDIVLALVDSGRIEEARKVAGTITSPPEQMSAFIYIAQALVKLGDITQAKAIAGSITYEGPQIIEEFVSIASALVQSGNTTEAKSLFNQARAMAEIITQKDIKERAFVYIAIALAQAGDITQAKAIAEIITDEFDKTTALVSIAKALANSGKPAEAGALFTEARKIAETITDSFNRFSAFTYIAKALAEIGKIEEARKIAETITNRSYQSKAFVSIAQSLAQSGNITEAKILFNQAREAAEVTTDNEAKSRLIVNIVKALVESSSITQAKTAEAKVGETHPTGVQVTELDADELFAEARQLTLEVGSEDLNRSLSSLARALALAGKIEEADKLAKEIKDSEQRSFAFISIAKVLVKTGRVTEAAAAFLEARKAAETMKNSVDKSGLLDSLAQVLAEAGRIEEARKVADMIDDRFWFKPMALASIAKALAKVGRTTEADATFLEARKAAENITTWQSATTLDSIAQALAEAGRIEEARKVAENIKESEELANVFILIAKALAKVGRTTEADAAFLEARKAADVEGRPSTLASLAQALAEAGRATEANVVFAEARRRVGKRIKEKRHQLQELVSIAIALVEANKKTKEVASLGEASQTGAQITGQDVDALFLEARQATQRRESEVIADIAQVLAEVDRGAEAGRIEEASKLAKEIEDDRIRSQALASIVYALAEIGKIEEAREVAKTITQSDWQAEALAFVAKALAKAGRITEADAAFLEALKLAEAVTTWQVQTLASIVQALAEAGRVEEARKLADTIEDGRSKSSALIAIAKAVIDRDREANIVTSSPAQSTLFSDAKPKDAPNSLIIVPERDRSGLFTLISNQADYGDNDITRLEDAYKYVERVGRGDTFIMGNSDNDFIIRAPDRILFNTRAEDLKNKSCRIVARRGDLILLEQADKTSGEKRYKVLDVYLRIESQGGWESRKSYLAPSGKFSVHEYNGRLFVSDNLGTYVMQGMVTTSSYRVDDTADVVIVQPPHGKYGLFSLEQRKFLIQGADHIEIDSSGEVAIFKVGNKLDYVWLNEKEEESNPLVISSKAKHQDVEEGGKVRVASKGATTYLMIIGKDGKIKAYLEFNREKGYAQEGMIPFGSIKSTLDESMINLMPQRYWEEYDSQKKTIWDSQENKERKPNYPGFSLAELNTYGSPINPQKTLSLYGSIAQITSVSPYNASSGPDGQMIPVHFLLNLDNNLYGNVEGEIMFLEGWKVAYNFPSERVTNRVEVTTEPDPSTNEVTLGFIGGTYFVTSSNKFLYIDNPANRSSSLVASDGRVVDISKDVPEGFVCTDTNGEYFVFVNPTTGQIKYLDPRRAFEKIPAEESTSPTQTNSEEEAQERALALASWKENVLSRRNALIAQAQTAYQPFFSLIPEWYRGELKDSLKEIINRLYAWQDKQIREKFQESFSKGAPLVIDGLAFEHFAVQLAGVRPLLEKYVRALRPRLAQEPYQIQRNIWLSLFTKLFGLSINSSLNVETIDNDFLEALAYGWDVSSQEQINAVPLITKLIIGLKESVPGIGITQISQMVDFLSRFVSRNPAGNLSILDGQLKKILELKPEVRKTYLEKMVEAFKGVDQKALNRYLHQPSASSQLGKAREFVVFLTNKVEQLSLRERFLPEGTEKMPQGSEGVTITQMMQLEEQRRKAQDTDVVMSVDSLISAIENNSLPKPSEEDEAKILLDTKVQRESGAYTAEIAQNSRDATSGKKGELVVNFYLQNNADGTQEYVEEAVDNGTGALYEVALLIPKSTKAGGAQKELTGFFGTGKYTIFEGADRVEVISKNNERAYMFTFSIKRDSSGNPISIKLTSIRQVNDSRLAQGVTVRRIKSVANTIPELDQMLARSAWKTFAGLAQNENFTISFVGRDGKREPLEVKYEVLAETEFRALERGNKEETGFGRMRLFATEDMPLQVVDRAGLRVCELKEECLALIPQALRKHIEELGLVIQIPLPLIRNRSAFELENTYLAAIQKYVAIEFYKAIAHKALTQTDPQFVFEGFANDLETNNSEDYWGEVLKDNQVVGLARKIAQEDYSSITEDELKSLLTEKDKLDKLDKFANLIILLEINTGKPQKESLYLRRIAILQESDRARAEEAKDRLRQASLSAQEPDLKDVPSAAEKLSQAQVIATAHDQLRNIKKYLVDPKDYTPEELELLELARPMAGQFGLDDVALVVDTVSFAGGFITSGGRKLMVLNRSVAYHIGIQSGPYIDRATDTIVHELAHLLEELMRQDDIARALKDGYVAHTSNFTHQSVGRFAEAMKYVAAITLANQGKNGNDSHLSQGPGTPASGQQLGEDSDVEAYLIGLRNPDPSVVQNAMVILMDKARENPKVIAQLQAALLNESDPEVQAKIQEIIAAALPSNPSAAPLPRLPAVQAPGGIDFRNLPLVRKAIGNLKPEIGNATLNRLKGVNLDNEWRKIENSFDSGIIPSAETIKEYLQASCLKGSIDTDIDRIISCIASILRFEEERSISTEPMLQDILIALESANSVQQLKAAFIGSTS